uniref:C2 domain-containing protein n=1 Tax=Angiostrongylus cantonensis TaxID=6313 RepID=A0A158PBD6_ANGCA
MTQVKSIAVIEMRFMNSRGEMAALTNGRLNSSTHQTLAPMLDEENERDLAYSQMTYSARHEQLEEIPGICAYAQFAVWQAGDVDLQQLDDQLRHIVGLGMCDVVTEFGILNLNIIEIGAQIPLSPGMHSSPHSKSLSSTRTPTAASERRQLRKRDSFDALPVATTPSLQTDSSARSKGNSVFSFETHRGSLASDIDRVSVDFVYPENHSLCNIVFSASCRSPDYVNPGFVSTAGLWFDFVVDKQSGLVSLLLEAYRRFCLKRENDTRLFCDTHGCSIVDTQSIRATSWYNARARLVREIGLHKMGITHLSPLEHFQSPSNNPYLVLVWRNPEELMDKDYPPDDLQVTAIDALPKGYSSSLFRLYRRDHNPHLLVHRSPCLIQDQLEQMRNIRRHVRDQLNVMRAFTTLHESLLSGNCEMSEADLEKLRSASKLVHFVETPVLLFPKWRRNIAEVRGAMELDPRKDKIAPAPLTSLTVTRQRANTLSVTPSAPVPFRIRSDDDDDPCQAKILYLLMADYVSYLSLLGLQLLKVTHVERRSEERHMYTTNYPQGCKHSPFVVMWKAMEGGIVLVTLSFKRPYFMFKIFIWRSACKAMNCEELCANSVQHIRELEHFKDVIVTECHLHSFTYDFHLRMLSKYLVGKDKNSEESTEQRRDDFMLVSSELKDSNDGTKELFRVVLRDNRHDRSELHLVFYLIAVATDIKSPLEEERHREDSRQSEVGEFKNFEKREPANRDNAEEVDAMVKRIIDGDLPSVVDGNFPTPIRRRFSSGGHLRTSPTLPPLNKTLNIAGFMKGAESDGDVHRVAIQGNAPRRHRKPACNEDGTIPGEQVTYVHFLSARQRSLQKVPENTAFGTHSFDSIIIMYKSVCFAKIEEVEDAVSQYSALLAAYVKDAEFLCRRATMWKQVLLRKTTRSTQPAGLGSIFLGSNPSRSPDSWNQLRSVSHHDTMKPSELKTLISIVAQHFMESREPRLCELLRGVNCARLCRFLLARFGPDRCRFFEFPNSFEKCLILTNPDLDAMFLVECVSDTTPTLSILLKEPDLVEDTQDESKLFRMVRAVLLTVVPMLVVATADGKRQNETGAITLNVAGSTLPSSSLLRGSDLIVDGQALKNPTDEISADILCALEKIFPNIESTEIEPQHCSQLISSSTNKVAISTQRQISKIRITPTKSKKARNKFITINLIGNGGKMRFDFEIGGKNVGKNFVLMWKTLISLVNSGRPYNNGIPKFHRREHMVSNPALSMTKYQFLEDSELIREVHLDQVTFVSDYEVEPEKTQEFSDKEIRSDVKPRAEQSQTAPNRNNTIISSMVSR